MKKSIFTLLILLAFSLTAMAQEQQGDKSGKKSFSLEEFRASQQKFITDFAKLTPEEADKFFPLYFELQDKKWMINNETRKKVGIKRNQKCTEEQYTQMVNEFADAKIKVAELEKEYVGKYLEVIPAKKIMDTQRAEDHFQKHMLNKMWNRGNRDNKHHNRGRERGSE